SRVDDARTGPNALPAQTGEQWPADWTLDQGARRKSRDSGVFLSKHGPSLITRSPIGKQGAMLVLCRLLDYDLLARLHRQTAVEFQLWALNDPALPLKALPILQSLLVDASVYLSTVGDDFYRVYATFPDLQGNPVLLLRSDVHR